MIKFLIDNNYLTTKNISADAALIYSEKDRVVFYIAKFSIIQFLPPDKKKAVSAQLSWTTLLKGENGEIL